jgi:hypothetical protein
MSSVLRSMAPLVASLLLVVPAMHAIVPASFANGTRQAADLAGALGKWRSTEQFEGESRLSFAFRQDRAEIVGWAVMLGQHRKGDHRATLALTFHGVSWEKGRLRFETMLPEDEGTIGWELQVTGQNRAVLRAVTEDGAPIPDAPSWEMTR